jgi:hypothetical protein
MRNAQLDVSHRRVDLIHPAMIARVFWDAQFRALSR